MTVETDLPDVEMEQKKVVWLTKHMFLALGTLTPASQAPPEAGGDGITFPRDGKTYMWGVPHVSLSNRSWPVMAG